MVKVARRGKVVQTSAYSRNKKTLYSRPGVNSGDTIPKKVLRDTIKKTSAGRKGKKGKTYTGGGF